MWCIKSPSTTYNYITTSVTTTSLHHNHVPTLVSTATLRDQRENHGEDSTTPFSGLGTVEKIQGDTQALNPLARFFRPLCNRGESSFAQQCSSFNSWCTWRVLGCSGAGANDVVDEGPESS